MGITEKATKTAEKGIKEAKEVAQDVVKTMKTAVKPSAWKGAFKKTKKGLLINAAGAGAALVTIGGIFSSFDMPSLTAPYVAKLPDVTFGQLPKTKAYAYGVLNNIGKPSVLISFAAGMFMLIFGGVARKKNPVLSKVLLSGGTMTSALVAWSIFAPANWKLMGKPTWYGADTFVPKATTVAGTYVPQSTTVAGNYIPAASTLGGPGDKVQKANVGSQGSGLTNPFDFYGAPATGERMLQLDERKPESAFYYPALEPGSQMWLPETEGDAQNMIGFEKFGASQFRNDDNARVFQWTAGDWNIRDIGAVEF